MTMVSSSALLIVCIISSACAVPQCACPRQFAPVCGSDGHVYSNRCLLDCHASILKSDLQVVKEGPCDAPEPTQCTCERTDKPVCGTDGVTYNNICLLRCERRKNPELEVMTQGTCSGRIKRHLYDKRYKMHRSRQCAYFY